MYYYSGKKCEKNYKYHQDLSVTPFCGKASMYRCLHNPRPHKTCIIIINIINNLIHAILSLSFSYLECEPPDDATSEESYQ